MKGLLLKDAYQAWYYAKMVVVAAVVMMGVGVISMMNGANFFIVYAGFLLGMMPMTLLAYDQTSKFNEYSAALPTTKEQLVGCKYIVGLCGLVLAEAFAAAALGVAQLHWVAVDSALVISTLVQVGMTTLLSSTANEDGLVRNLLPQSISSLGLLGIAVVALALYALSWRLSVAWYGKAEQ